MDTTNPSLDTLTPAQKRPLPRRLEHIMSRKAYLRNKLLRAEHHLSYFQICENTDRVPLGIRLERKFNPIELDTPSSTGTQIEHILQKMKREIQNILVQHYKNILPDLQDELHRLEERLREIDQNKETSTAEKSLIRKKEELTEKDEDRLLTALQKSKRWKLKMMHRVDNKRPT